MDEFPVQELIDFAEVVTIQSAETDEFPVHKLINSVGNQYVYMKRRSTDTTMYRDVSLKSIRSQAGMVEAPISEVLSLLRDAAGRVEGDAAQLVKDAVKDSDTILRWSYTASSSVETAKKKRCGRVSRQKR
ncbi:hypothetical protein ANCCEY_02449 [Ancylostoma ceylanicum]|uniref:Uncharacterized protein n=1 Tax=Ancylostoma ceylanicum TaxID=53326 RepID=A0A0D6M2Z7_9BILA|nr:hypothetical protein ANCCEY_02449 [Ancylostoma ceylanicum]